jgi:DNA-binding NarL/FixJ family response regulator
MVGRRERAGMTEAVPVRVVVADDQRAVRDGLAMLVGLCEGIEVVGTAPDGAAAVAMVDELAGISVRSRISVGRPQRKSRTTS